MMLVFSLFDKKAQVYARPFFEQSVGVAARAIGDEMRRTSDQPNLFRDHPEDFTLYQIGTFDEENGYIEVPDAPLLIVELAVLAGK